MIRRRFVLRGVVQGVGFRPHVARVASRREVTGFCGNDDESVFIEAQGDDAELTALLDSVLAELPPLARVTSVESAEVEVDPAETGFAIVESRRQAGAVTLIPPDIARCADCLRELNDPTDRRFGYPFISCTNCGPRFSIVRDVPYDRAKTTLAEFPMCAACAAEYTNPLDRRFHAEPISCYDCGPRLWLERDGVEVAEWADAVAVARSMLAEGLVVAVKGMGGVMLMCDARNETAVARLRARKNRPDKPLAVMAADASSASSFARLSEEQTHELTASERPIVLAPKGDDYDLAPSIAPGLDQIGVMLPSAPLHDLLLGSADVVVATSGNRSGEPLCYRNDDARRDLAGIADALLLNDRDIHVPVEDSVLLADGDGVLPIRRSRGFAPLPIPMGGRAGDVLAVGGEIKNSFTLTRDGMAFVSAHIGDLGSLATQRAFEASVAQLVAAHRREPEQLVADLHPSYSTTAWAQRRAEATGTPLLRVQHHHAHALSLLAEHGELGSTVLCAVFDGTGFGDDRTIWGGEILRVHGISSDRVWHLPAFQLAGGDSAVQKPWKSAIGLLDTLGIDDGDLPPVAAADAAELRLVRSQLATRTATVLTSSAGRLFDAIASILDVRHAVSYEAQAAMELEAAARGCAHPDHARADAETVGDAVRDAVVGRRAGVATACLARSFHAALAAITARELIAGLGDAAAVGLSGGVFQNRMLTGDTVARLAAAAPGLRVLRHAVVPANDGGLSLGQAAAGLLALAADHATTEGEAACA